MVKRIMASYFIQWKGVVQGPYQESAVKQMISSNQVSRMHLISVDRLTWIPLAKSALYAEVSGSLTPKPPPQEAAHKTKLALKQQPAVQTTQPQRRAWIKRMVPESIMKTPEPISVNVSSLNGDAEQIGTECNGVNYRPQSQAYTVNFNIVNLVSRVFAFHTKAELDDMLTENKDGVSTIKEQIECPKTWFYSRVFLWLFLLTAVMLFLSANIKIFPGLILLGTFCMPIVCVTFFFELNICRNVSVLKVISVFIIGGVFSLLFTHLIYPHLAGLEAILQEASAGIVEEPAKLFILLFFIGNTKRYPYILNGVLLGATVGAGFAAFESAGYAFESFMVMLHSEKPEWSFIYMLENIFQRGYLAPFCHIVWTGLIGGALWTVRGFGRFNFSLLLKQRMIVTFLLSVFLHMLWNTEYRSVKLLGAIAWIGIFHYIRLGLQQLADEQVGLLRQGDE